jgi:anti-anti-sigma regulatory factor
MNDTFIRRAGETATSTLVDGCLVVTLPREIATSLSRLQEYVLRRTQDSQARAVVIEMAAVQFIDRSEFEGLRAMVEMLRFLGTPAAFISLHAGIVAYLLENDIDTSGLTFKAHLEDALRDRFEIIR